MLPVSRGTSTTFFPGCEGSSLLEDCIRRRLAALRPMSRPPVLIAAQGLDFFSLTTGHLFSRRVRGLRSGRCGPSLGSSRNFSNCETALKQDSHAAL